MLRVDHRYHYDLTPEKIDALVAERGGSPPARPATPHPLPTLPLEGEGSKPKRTPRKKVDG
jgi:hypothetical protein